MRRTGRFQQYAGMGCIAALLLAVLSGVAVPLLHAQNAPAKILAPADVSGTMPQTVFFRGQTATVQLRNTYGLRFSGGALLLAGMVDSSGYSTGIRQKYQGYLLTEVPVTVNGKTLGPGAYGFGFLSGNAFAIMDIGAHEVLRTKSTTDAKLHRPRPLTITDADHPGSYRLYAGRDYVTIQRQ